MSGFHLAQVNIGRIKAPLEDALMAGFVNRLNEINGLAESSPGFVWRLQTSEGNATYLRPFDDGRTLLNMSVWESVEALKDYVYRTAHVELLRQRQDWLRSSKACTRALWWVPAGIFRASTKPRSAWRIWKRTGLRSSHSPSRQPFRQMRGINKRLTGEPSSLVLPFRGERIRTERQG